MAKDTASIIDRVEHEFQLAKLARSLMAMTDTAAAGVITTMTPEAARETRHALASMMVFLMGEEHHWWYFIIESVAQRRMAVLTAQEGSGDDTQSA